MDADATIEPTRDGTPPKAPTAPLLGDDEELDGLAARAERFGEPSGVAEARNSQWQPIGGYVAAPPKRRSLLWLLLPIAFILLALNVHLVYQGQLLLRTGQVTAIEHGTLLLRITPSGPWSEATAGRTVAQGASLQAKEPTVATITFFDGSLMRIESAGEWEIIELRGNRSHRVSRVTIRQYWGTASYVAAPLRAGYENTLQIQVPWATLELTGVATLASDGQGLTRIRLLQGHGFLATGGYTYRIREGQAALIGEGKLLTVEDAS